MEKGINAPLTLPCGAVLRNRITKAAMTEGLADSDNRATKRLNVLYKRWAEGGAGLLLTGNVQVDRRYMERPGNVAIDGPQSAEAIAALRDYAQAGTCTGNHLWMQISHAGRQTPASVSKEPVGPSDKVLQMPGGQFGKPRALTHDEILDIIKRFVHTATIARETGFTGVQIHGAHGYLISEFLSPDVNTREDDWGGSLENRSRLLLEIVRKIRKAVGADFPVAVKLNSADFQKGGFSHEESMQVAQWLNKEGIDLLEISGGTYEQPKMVGADGLTTAADKAEKRRESTIAREAYFLEYAKGIRAVTTVVPLMVTGGFRSRAGMDAALSSGVVDVIGLARPLCVDPDLPSRLLTGDVMRAPDFENSLRLGPGLLGPHSPVNFIRALNGWGQQGWFCLQIIRMGDGLDPDTEMGVFRAFRAYQKNEALTAASLRQG